MAQRLGQVELMERGPTRKLIVAQGATAWFGVDPGTRRVAIAVVSADGVRSHRVVSIPALEGGERLAKLAIEVELAAWGLVRDGLAPGVIVVEQPSGAQPNPSLSYATGAIIGALWTGVARAGVRTIVETVSSSAWKKEACGRGDIGKPKVASEVAYPVLVWARSVGYEGSSWDVADAMGISEYARRTIALEER